MHDIKYIRENTTAFEEKINSRNINCSMVEILKTDEELREKNTALQSLQSEKNNIAEEISIKKRQGSETSAINTLMERGAQIGEQITKLKAEETQIKEKLESLLAKLHIMPADSVPKGVDETENQVIRSHGIPRQFNFSPKAHYEVGEGLGKMDFKQTAEISGARFVTLKSELAALERALTAFMIDCHTSEFGYTELSTPHLVRDHAMYNVGQLPKFDEDSFKTTDGYRLIPTGEVTLTNMVCDTLLQETDLPIRMTAHTQCFRSEAGSAGRDMRGMIRLHQFSKVELVSIVKPEESDNELERMTSAAENILKKLELPYRIVLLCTGDMGFSATKTYDIEVWIPSENKYREISSCSNCGDFQARRLRARYKEASTKKNRLLHTLNGSGLAIGRCLAAILENYQNEDGSVNVPTALRKYINNISVIKP